MSRQLTFGVEFEFAVAACKPGKPDPHPSHPGRVHFPVAHNPENPHPYCDTHDYIYDEIRTALHKAGLPLKHFKNIIYDNWSVTDDISIVPPPKVAPCNHPNYDFHSCEVISPALYYCPESLDQLRVATAVLTTKFRAVAASSTGLHVHVGDGADGFSLNTLRNLVSFLWAFESQLQTLHPPHRHKQQWCVPLRDDTVYAWGHRGVTVYSALNDFFSPELDTEAKLLELFKICAGGQTAVKFENLVCPTSGAKQTIEFRAHAGSLDGEEAVMWVRTVVGFVVWARDVDRDQFMMVMSCAEAGNADFNVVELLGMIGLNEEAAFYKNRLHPLNASDEIMYRPYNNQPFAQTREDVFNEFGITAEGVATKKHWRDEQIFDPYA